MAFGFLDAVLPATIEQFKPEDGTSRGGKRSPLCFFDRKLPFEIPAIAEPLLMGLYASLEIVPRDECGRFCGLALREIPKGLWLLSQRGPRRVRKFQWGWEID